MKRRIAWVAVLSAAVAALLVAMSSAGWDVGGGRTEAGIAEPQDTLGRHDWDKDGCHSEQEVGSDATHGGDRDRFNPWDWYDVASAGGTPEPDAVIDLPNDILGVIVHFAPLGTEPEYDVHYDRGPWTGPNSWTLTTGPDGVIDLPNDILGVIGQSLHNCQHVD